MADASPMTEKFGGKKRPPKFADEGPPSDSDNSRGGGTGDSYGADSAMPDDGDMGGGDPTSAGGPPDGADPEEKSVDDMADILGVGPEDREDFAASLQTYVHACIAKVLGGGPDMAGPAMPDVGGSEPDSDDEEGPSPEEG